ncbi:hypothetical protein [Rudanella lutea]|uniref:hypothetical protein n=1 Tax=Rudanella lutea TaxID=451374 RepID=UPI00035DB41A|nr:hypothetical protein [Rudanella lutea]
METTKQGTSLDKLYNLRKDFLVIGLTGRLGSGCTEVAKLLRSQTFSACNFPQPINRDFTNNEARKYRIVYNFMQSNWDPFTLIRASDIITAILLENELDAVISYLAKEYKKGASDITSWLDKEIVHNGNTLRKEYEELRIEKLAIEAVDDKSGDCADVERKKDLAYKFYVEDGRLSKFAESIKRVLIDGLKSSEKASPYQYFGNNIRMSGNAIDNSKQSDDYYKIPKILDEIIETTRSRNKLTGKKTWIVIDSIRNSLEAFYFKERYSSFYLFAINTDNEHRYKRLDSHYNKRELERLDQEYDDDVKAHEKFYKQDIKSCIQSSDIYLYNPTDDANSGDTRRTLKQSLIRYLALILQPGIITPTPTERCMQIAYTAKYNSGCISRQVGAVVTDSSFSIKSIGWNNTAEGQTPCLLRNVNDLITNSDSNAFSTYEKTGKIRSLLETSYPQSAIDERSNRLLGRNTSFCFKEGQNCLDGEKNQVHTRSLHAEENAMLQISKYGGEGLKDGFLFTTASPCELCSKKAFQLGIKKIFYIDPYPGIAKEQIIDSGDSNHQPELCLFSGAIGRAYHQIFEPFMPYKDELKIRLDYNYSTDLETVIKNDEADTKAYINDLQNQKDKIEKILRRLAATSEKKRKGKSSLLKRLNLAIHANQSATSPHVILNSHFGLSESEYPRAGENMADN